MVEAKLNPNLKVVSTKCLDQKFAIPTKCHFLYTGAPSSGGGESACLRRGTTTCTHGHGPRRSSYTSSGTPGNPPWRYGTRSFRSVIRGSFLEPPRVGGVGYSVLGMDPMSLGDRSITFPWPPCLGCLFFIGFLFLVYISVFY